MTQSEKDLEEFNRWFKSTDLPGSAIEAAHLGWQASRTKPSEQKNPSQKEQTMQNKIDESEAVDAEIIGEDKPELTQQQHSEAFAAGILKLAIEFSPHLNLGAMIGALQVVQLDLYAQVSRTNQQQQAKEAAAKAANA